MDLMDLKSKILEELLGDLEDHEGSKLKPKAADVSIMAMKPEGDDDEESSEEPSSEGHGDEGEDEEMMKKLLEGYLSRG